MPQRDKFELTIDDLGNAAFDGPAERLDEVARILRHAADEVEAGKGNAYLYDVNGNKVGSWSLDPWQAPDDDDDGYPPPCTDPGGHDFPPVEEHERSLCTHCGADGDA